MAGCLPGHGLGHGGGSPEVFPGDGEDVHHRVFVLPLQEAVENPVGLPLPVLVRYNGHEVDVGVGAVVAGGPRSQEDDLRRFQPPLHLVGNGEAYAVWIGASLARSSPLVPVFMTP